MTHIFEKSFTSYFKFKEVKEFNNPDFDFNYEHYAFFRYLKKILSRQQIIIELAVKHDPELNLNLKTIYGINRSLREKKKEAIKLYIEKIDEEIFKLSKNYDKSKVEIKSVKILERFIHLKSVGKINFKVRLYKIFHENKTIFLFPTLMILSIDNNGLLIGSKEEMLLTYVETKSIRKAADLYGMSKDKFHQIIKKAIINKPEIKQLTDKECTVFVNLDGLWIRNNKKAYEEIKDVLKSCKDKREIISVTLFTGSKEKYKSKQREIENKFSYWFDEWKTLEENLAILKNNIKILYPNCKDIVVIGDGAAWIKGAAKILGGKYVMDNFHYVKILILNWSKCMGSKRKIQKLIKKVKSDFYEMVHDKVPLLEIIKKITLEYDVLSGETIEKKDLEKIFEYNIKHFNEFKAALDSKYVSIIEAEQSRLVANYLRYSRASFGMSTPERIRLMATTIYNNINTTIDYYDPIDALWEKTKLNDQNNNSCNNISCEVSSIATSKETSSNGSWVTQKKKSDY